MRQIIYSALLLAFIAEVNPVSAQWSTTGTTVHPTTSGNKVAIGTSTAASKFDVEGGISIGSAYSGTTAAPTDGAIIEGFVGIGLTNPSNPFHLAGNGRIGILGSGTPSSSAVPTTNGLFFSGGASGGSYDRDNSDPMYIARINRVSDVSEMRINFSDNANVHATTGPDSFVVAVNNDASDWESGQLNRLSVDSWGRLTSTTSTTNDMLDNYLVSGPNYTPIIGASFSNTIEITNSSVLSAPKQGVNISSTGTWTGTDDDAQNTTLWLTARDGNDNTGLVSNVAGTTDGAATGGWFDMEGVAGSGTTTGILIDVDVPTGSTGLSFGVDINHTSAGSVVTDGLNISLASQSSGESRGLDVSVGGTGVLKGGYINVSGNIAAANSSMHGLRIESTSNHASTLNKGIDVLVSGAGTDYAGIFMGGNSGFGTAVPGNTVEIDKGTGVNCVTGLRLKQGAGITTGQLCGNPNPQNYLAVNPATGDVIIVPQCCALESPGAHNHDHDQSSIDQADDNETIQSLRDEVASLTKRLVQLETMGLSRTSSVNNSRVDLETKGIRFTQNTPNPFNSRTNIEYSIPVEFSEAYLIVIDAPSGKIIDRIFLPERGFGVIDIDASRYSSSSYLYTIEIDEQRMPYKKMVVLK